MKNNGSPLSAMPRALRIALTVAAITLGISLLWLFISTRVVNAMLESRADSATWHMAFDGLFAVAIVTIMCVVTYRAVSHLEQSERLLRDNEARLNRITTNSLVLICEIDAQGNFCYVGPSYRSVLGYDPAQLIGRSVMEYVHPDDVARVELEAQPALKEGSNSSRIELRVRHADGRYLWIESSSQFVLDSQQQIIGAMLINRDITSHKQAEDTLARYARNMRALYEASLAINSQPDVATLLNAIPQRATDLLGASMGGNIIGVLSVEDAEPGLFTEEDVGLASLFADQAVIAIENHQLYEQTQRELLVRRQTEEALRHSEQLYRTLIENLGEGICFVDENENLTFVNPAANEIFGMEPGGLDGHNLNEFLPPEEFAAIRHETEIGRTGRTSTYETQIIHPDGRLRTLLVTARPRFDSSGVFLGAFSVFRDVTERKQAEAELTRTRANLERRNQQLIQILEAGNLQRMNLDLDAVLNVTVKGANRALGYSIVVLNMLDINSQKMIVHSYAGLDEAGQQALAGGVYSWEEERRLFRSEFLLGRAYFIPEGALDWQREASGPMYVPDLPISDRVDAWHPDDVLFIPIEMRDGSIAGTIWLDAPQDGQRPTVESLRPLEIFVNQAAVTIENARLFEAERQRHRELEAVYLASRQLTQSLELSEVLVTVLSSVMQLVPATSAQLFLYDGDRLTFGSGLSEHDQKMTEPPLEPRPKGLTYTVARTGHALFIEDTARHPEFNATSTLSSPLLAIAGLPLKMEDTVLGVMNISYVMPHYFSDSERSILSLLAAQAAIALHNARLHKQVQSHATELERRVAERTAELDHERQHLQAILDSAGEGIQLMSPGGHVAYANPATERITGYAAAETVGQVTRLWSDDLNSTSSVAGLREQVLAGRPWQGEIINRRKDGTLYDAAVTVTPLKDQRQQVTEFVVVHRDITRLKELDRLKDQFVSRIGHELRTPIANIKLYTQLLERGKPDKQHEYFQTIQHEIDRLTHLNDSFLEMAELDAGRTPLRLAAVDVNQLLRDMLRNVEQIAQRRDLTLQAQLDVRLNGPMVMTDRALLARAISNLLDNALRYAPRAATITVRTSRVDPTTTHGVTVAVHNTGPGISHEELPHMCERFYRGEAARDYKVPGAGLGLAIAQTIMRQLNGLLTVDSSSGQGVTFTLWLK